MKAHLLNCGLFILIITTLATLCVCRDSETVSDGSVTNNNETTTKEIVTDETTETPTTTKTSTSSATTTTPETTPTTTGAPIPTTKKPDTGFYIAITLGPLAIILAIILLIGGYRKCRKGDGEEKPLIPETVWPSTIRCRMKHPHRDQEEADDCDRQTGAGTSTLQWEKDGQVFRARKDHVTGDMDTHYEQK